MRPPIVDQWQNTTNSTYLRIHRNLNHPPIQRKKEENQFLNVSKVRSRPHLHVPSTRRHQSNRNLDGSPRQSSPTSWSVISRHQSNQQRLDLHDASTSSSYVSFAYEDRAMLTESPRTFSRDRNKQHLSDGRHHRLGENPPKASCVESASHTSSHHTYPFTCAAEFDTLMESSIDVQPADDQKGLSKENIPPTEHDQVYRSSETEKLAEISQVLSGPLTISIPADDIRINDDSDDGWSNESAEILYSDDHHLQSKKKLRITSSKSTTLKPLEQH